MFNGRGEVVDCTWCAAALQPKTPVKGDKDTSQINTPLSEILSRRRKEVSKA